MNCKVNVQCINERVCETCEEMEITVTRVRVPNKEQNRYDVINNFRCSNYGKCSRLLRFLNENKDDIKYIGRDGD